MLFLSRISSLTLFEQFELNHQRRRYDVKLTFYVISIFLKLAAIVSALSFRVRF